jgi:DNA-directed RNA polymerase specialized sigma24 family protein
METTHDVSSTGASADGLLARCAAGRCSESWKELLDRFGHKISAGVGRALARFGCRNPIEMAEDLRQDVFLRLLADDARILTRCRGRSDREIGAYLFRVAESVAVDHLRRLLALKRGGAPCEDEAPVRVASESDPACDRPGPESRLILEQERGRFLALCRRLVGAGQTRRDLQIVYLALFQDCSSREIARRSGGLVTAGAVDSLIHRVRRGLAAQGLELPQRRRRRPGVS